MFRCLGITDRACFPTGRHDFRHSKGRPACERDSFAIPGVAVFFVSIFYFAVIICECTFLSNVMDTNLPKRGVANIVRNWGFEDRLVRVRWLCQKPRELENEDDIKDEKVMVMSP
jgi:hypothetical protein